MMTMVDVEIDGASTSLMDSTVNVGWGTSLP